MTDHQNVRVRVAPSPTGDPHVGTAYVALFNYCLAQKNNGSFILRIEDTDQTRYRKKSEEMILNSLKWLGIIPDEGPGLGGDYGPYRQSERKLIYREKVDELIDKGEAYKCFCTPERLDELRKSQREKGEQTGYDRLCRSLSKGEFEARLADNQPYVVRLKMPIDGDTTFYDELRGDVTIANQQLDDQVILKSDGFPTYHLANVVDDHLMKISHVMRAEEWISSTPKHVLLYKAFGWEAPKWIHLPLLRNSDKSKISKRKNPVSLQDFERMGILPEALVNFLALMGWSFGDDVEKFSLGQMIEKFDLKNISLGGPVFDLVKLNWLNKLYLAEMSESQFVCQLRENVFSEEYLGKIYPLIRERIDRFDQFVDKAGFFFTGTLAYGDASTFLPKGKSHADMRKMLKAVLEKIDVLDDWGPDDLQGFMDSHRQELEWNPRDYFMTIRLIVTGRKDSPPLAETMSVLGKEVVRLRLRDAEKNLFTD